MWLIVILYVMVLRSTGRININGLEKMMNSRWSWLWMPVIPRLKKLRQENLEFKDSKAYMVKPCQK